MNSLDLFSGIGGITYALKDYVIPVAYCEIDRYCQGVLNSRMQDGTLPKAQVLNDITNLDKACINEILWNREHKHIAKGDHLRPSDDDKIDIITAGFP